MARQACKPSPDRPDPRYPFPTERDETGRIIYLVPVPAESDDALTILGANENGRLRFLRYGEGKPEPVVYIRTTDAAFAYDQRSYLNTRRTRQNRYEQRFQFFEGTLEGENGMMISRDEHPLLEYRDPGYEEVEVSDLRDRMVAYVSKRYPRNPLYGRVLEMYLKYGYGAREIGEQLNIRERAVRYFLDQARPVAADYYNRFVL